MLNVNQLWVISIVKTMIKIQILALQKLKLIPKIQKILLKKKRFLLCRFYKIFKKNIVKIIFLIINL
jgi:hypothetical protein